MADSMLDYHNQHSDKGYLMNKCSECGDYYEFGTYHYDFDCDIHACSEACLRERLGFPPREGA